MTNRARFLAAGGERFEYIPALDASGSHAAMLAELVLRHGQGWPEFDPGWDGARVSAQRATARSRHERMRDGMR
jgi:ferrochelatase